MSVVAESPRPVREPAPAPAGAAPAAPAAGSAARKREYSLLGAIPFVVAHLAAFGAIWTGVTAEVIWLGLGVLWVRTFAITAFYHRYFAHRTFSTSRVAQFVFAYLAQTSSQRGVLWWAAHHRVHHRCSDQEGDVHSPVTDGFWHSHFGWLFERGAAETRWEQVQDFARYPELRFLDRFWLLPPVSLAVLCFAWMGWPGLFIGFFASTIALWHITFTVNSLAHVIGTRRFETSDDSRNNWLIALLTFGEGWHNNHHHYPGSTRQGFRWWEIDISYYGLKLLSYVGIVWDLREPPQRAMQPTARS